MKLAKNLTPYMCVIGTIALPLGVPASAKDASLTPDTATIDSMESECSLVIEDRWPAFTEEYRKGQIKEELVKTCLENAKLRYFSAAQNQINQDSAEQEAVARQQYHAALEKREKTIRDIAQTHEEKMRQWRADVLACKSGDYSKCAQPVE